MSHLFLVMLGGAFGAGARHLVGRCTLLWFGPGYPLGTLAVNVAGGFAMGIAAAALARLGTGGEQLRLLVATGFLGGFTTFSAFSLDVVAMAERGDLAAAAGYVLLSVVGAIAALIAGLGLVRALA